MNHHTQQAKKYVGEKVYKLNLSKQWTKKVPFLILDTKLHTISFLNFDILQFLKRRHNYLPCGNFSIHLSKLSFYWHTREPCKVDFS